MPWLASDAIKHNAKATTENRQRLWAKVANRVLKVSGDEGQAIRAANAALDRGIEQAK